MKKIAVITSSRDGKRFLDRWIAYYGATFGHENLFVFLDGHDQDRPDAPKGANIIALPYVARSRLAGDKARAARASALAKALFTSYDLVIATDVDEFILVDPKLDMPLADYLSTRTIKDSLSAMGIDVARNNRAETALDWAQPFLGQRRFGELSDRYTKAAVLGRPLQWGSGQHRVRGHGFAIDPNLYLFHFGSVDEAETAQRENDADRTANGWAAHQVRRNAVLDVVSTAPVKDADQVIDTARKYLSKPRSLIAWNKPRPLTKSCVIEIPTRFFGIV